MKRFTVPTIEWDGKIGELEVDDLGKPFLRVLPAKSQFGTNDFTKMDYDQFHPKLSAYKIDKSRMAEVVVFVHDAYLKQWSSEVRDLAIQKHVKENAIWMFTYANRKIV